MSAPILIRRWPRWPWSLLLAALVLAVAVLFPCLSWNRRISKPRSQSLAVSIPSALVGWTGRDVPLGTTEFLSGEVEKILNFDDVVDREFSRGDVSFGVYVAYWGAGKMPAQLVASHTPDCCWTLTGWRCLKMKFKQVEVLDGAAMKPAEWRQFEPPSGGQPTYVLYWHLVDGRAYDYGRRFNYIPSPWVWWRAAIQQLLYGNGEQYFIRLTSSVPLESLWKDPGFNEVLRSLANLGLVEKAPAGGSR